MKTQTLKQLVLYNYRYIFGYLIIDLFAGYFLVWRLGTLVSGLASQEMSAAATHVSLKALANLPVAPVHGFLQFISMQLFGINSAAIRLPSVIIGGATVIVIYFLLKKWFGKPTAMIGSALLISADWFLFISRLGTGSIEFSFWLSLGLLSLTRVLERRHVWLVYFSLSIAALLFIPFGPYAALTLLVGLVGCKVFRSRMNEVDTPKKALSYSLVALGVIGAAAISFINTEFLKQIFVIESLPNVQQFLTNIFINSSSVVAILPNANPEVSPATIAMIRFFELIFVLFGVAMLFKTRVNRLNLTVIVLTTVLVIVSGLSADASSRGIFIVPSVIFMTAGIRHLIHRWKRMFPKNPYARIVAYVPLAILFFSVVALHQVTYFQLWSNQTETQQAFSVDSKLAVNALNNQNLAGKSCFVESEDSSTQTLIAASETACKPIFSDSSLEQRESAALLLVKPGSSMLKTAELKPERALVGTTKSDNVRWLVVNRANN